MLPGEGEERESELQARWCSEVRAEGGSPALFQIIQKLSQSQFRETPKKP